MKVSVRRGAARLAAVFTVLAASVALGAAPARADEDRVQVDVPSSFTAGGSARTVTVAVTRRSDGCADVRTTLGLALPGLSADSVHVQVEKRGDWEDVALSAQSPGLVNTEGTAPTKDRLCERKTVTVRYRVAFLDGAPGGTVYVAAGAFAATGAPMGKAVEGSRVKGGASPTPSASATPSPTAEPTEVAAPAPQQSRTAAPALVGTQQDGGGSGLGTAVMLVGVAMVGIGIGLIVLLLRRGRDDRDAAADAHAPAAAYAHGPAAYAYPAPPSTGVEHPTLILPKAVSPPPASPGAPPPAVGDQAQTMILPKLPD